MRRRLAIAACIALVAVAGTAFAQQRSAAWLMSLLRAQASQYAVQARAAHRDRDADTWSEWATSYDKLANDASLQHIDALAFARNNAKFNQEEALVMSRNGSALGADLYGASARMWEDLARQLASGTATPAVHFPEKRMLTPIAGLAGTPWQNLGGHHATDCRTLAQRAQSCRTQLARLRHHDLLTGQSGDYYQVVTMQRCDAAQELYVAQCQQ